MSYNNQLAVSLNDIGQIRHILSVLHRKGDRKYGQKRPENPAYPDADPSGIYQPAPRKACSEHFRQGALRKSGHQPGELYTHYTDIYDLMHQMEDEMMADIQTALKPLLDSDISDLTPLKITTGIFRCLKESADTLRSYIGEIRRQGICHTASYDRKGTLPGKLFQIFCPGNAETRSNATILLSVPAASACWRNGLPTAWQPARKRSHPQLKIS